jgi:hypothetical protein
MGDFQPRLVFCSSAISDYATLRCFGSAKKFFGATVRIYSQGDSNVTSGAAAALLQNDTAMISVVNRIIAV